MLEREFSYDLLHAPRAQGQEKWFFQLHMAEFEDLGALENNALYLRLAARVQNFECARGSARVKAGLSLPLKAAFLQGTLLGSVSAEYVSAAKGERRSHLESIFPLPGAWTLCLSQIARQEIISGRVRLATEFYFMPGRRDSFRFAVAARALAWALSRSLRSFTGAEDEQIHG